MSAGGSSPPQSRAPEALAEEDKYARRGAQSVLVPQASSLTLRCPAGGASRLMHQLFPSWAALRSGESQIRSALREAGDAVLEAIGGGGRKRKARSHT